MLHWAHQSPHCKWHLNRLSCFCTADGRMSLHFTMGRPFFLKIAPFNGEICTIPWAHSRQQPKWHLDRFSNLCTDDHKVSPYFTMGRPFPFSKLSLPIGRSGLPCNTWFPRPSRVLSPNGISIGSAFFAGLTSVTDRQTYRQTDRHCYYVGNNRPRT